MKKTFLLALTAAFICQSLSAQYYYRDIVSNLQLQKEMALFRENKVRSVVIRSFEDDGSESEGFFCEKKISKDYRKAELFTRSDISGSSLFTSTFDKEGKILGTTDSSTISLSVNTYTYDEAGRIRSILSSVKSSDDDFANEILEEHIYEYNSSGIPVKMTRIKNRTDSAVMLFQVDEHNNVAIEKDSKTGRKYYYYYDEKNRLTDVVHSTEYTTKLLPDYQFEYNNAGNISQMTSTEEGGTNYYVWRYTYSNGLRSSEKCYTKERKLMGSVQYEYK
ncbi:MAG: hypothetical protein JST02_13195 [Bacteroidetes bacterium]|nr:hypothetical protein [Bacteroidota bacterium]